jgi:hypothetical protein
MGPCDGKYEATIRLLQLPFPGTKAPAHVDGTVPHVAIDTDDDLRIHDLSRMSTLLERSH